MEDVYVMTFLPTGKKYVGKTARPLRHRLDAHLSKLRRGVHSSKELQNDFDVNSGTIDDFTIEKVDEQVLKRGLSMDKEREWMVKLKTYDAHYGYNVQDPSMRKIREQNDLPVRRPDYWWKRPKEEGE